jgi:1-acyl-sn-glycerol-3-phosphate acyltransferase
MNPLLPVAVVVQKILVGVPCRIDDSEFKKVPAEGPIIAIANHISSLEVPVMLSHLHPRLVTGMAKSDAWNNPIYRLLYTIYRAVPVRRGEVDLNAIKLSMERLKEKYILAVAPEGTRSHDGKLQQARAGVALLAVKSGAPVMPMCHYGGESLAKNLRRFKRTPFILKVGNPFTIDLHGERMNKEVSQMVVDEMMWQVAALLPPFYRGYYSNLDQATEKYLHFEPGVESNLKRAAEMNLIRPPVV